jgi:hypothetical protein
LAELATFTVVFGGVSANNIARWKRHELVGARHRAELAALISHVGDLP